jgi:hypothetical protein
MTKKTKVIGFKEPLDLNYKNPNVVVDGNNVATYFFTGNPNGPLNQYQTQFLTLPARQSFSILKFYFFANCFTVGAVPKVLDNVKIAVFNLSLGYPAGLFQDNANLVRCSGNPQSTTLMIDLGEGVYFNNGDNLIFDVTFCSIAGLVATDEVQFNAHMIWR